MGTIADPLANVVEGLLRGHQLGMQLKQAADQHQAFLTNQALHNQQMSIQDIMNKGYLEENARPVTGGMVTSPAIPASVSTPLGVPGPGNTAPQSDVDVSGGSYARPVDKSRMISYGGQDYERKTPEELLQSRLADAVAMKHAGMTPVEPTAAMKALNINHPVWVDDNHLAQYAHLTGQLEPIQTPAAYQEAGGPAQVPTSMLPKVITFAERAAAQQAAREQAEANRKSREGIAQLGATTRTNVATATQKAAAERQAARNATTIEAAGIRRNQPTEGQAGVANRFDVRRQDQAQKQMADVQAKENEAHAERLKIGQMLSSPGVKDADRQAAATKMKALNFQVQAYQTRKATIAGAQTPPKAVQDQIPEGKKATAPDGHTWLKKDGIVYFIK